MSFHARNTEDSRNFFWREKPIKGNRAQPSTSKPKREKPTSVSSPQSGSSSPFQRSGIQYTAWDDIWSQYIMGVETGAAPYVSTQRPTMSLHNADCPHCHHTSYFYYKPWEGETLQEVTENTNCAHCSRRLRKLTPQEQVKEDMEMVLNEYYPSIA